MVLETSTLPTELYPCAFEVSLYNIGIIPHLSTLCNPLFKKSFDFFEKYEKILLTSAPLWCYNVSYLCERAFLLCPAPPEREGISAREGGTLGRHLRGNDLKIYNGRCRKKWLMTQESRLLWCAPSASREITTQRRTRRTILTDLSSTSSAASAKSTLFTENPSNRVKESKAHES